MRFAREGVYPQSIAADLSEERLNQFFTKQGNDAYAVANPLRESILFSVQNLITEPPFSKLDFISCRNVLIYIILWYSGESFQCLPSRYDRRVICSWAGPMVSPARAGCSQQFPKSGAFTVAAFLENQG